MPKSKNPEAYPLEYAELVRRIDAGQKVTLEFPDKRSAEALRFDLYGYRNALAASQHELQYIAARLIARIEINLKGGYLLHLSSQMDEPVALQLRNVFAKLDTETTPTQIPPVDSGEPLAKATIPPSPFTAKDAGAYEEEDTNEQEVYKKYLTPTQKVSDPKEKG